MSYAMQRVVWEARQPQNDYGDITYKSPMIVPARKQHKQQIVKTAEGKQLLSKNIYYIKPPIAFSISQMDKLDGDIIIEKYEMRSLGGLLVMARFITV